MAKKDEKPSDAQVKSSETNGLAHALAEFKAQRPILDTIEANLIKALVDAGKVDAEISVGQDKYRIRAHRGGGHSLIKVEREERETL